MPCRDRRFRQLRTLTSHPPPRGSLGDRTSFSQLDFTFATQALSRLILREEGQVDLSPRHLTNLTRRDIARVRPPLQGKSCSNCEKRFDGSRAVIAHICEEVFYCSKQERSKSAPLLDRRKCRPGLTILFRYFSTVHSTVRQNFAAKLRNSLQCWTCRNAQSPQQCATLRKTSAKDLSRIMSPCSALIHRPLLDKYLTNRRCFRAFLCASVRNRLTAGFHW